MAAEDIINPVAPQPADAAQEPRALPAQRRAEADDMNYGFDPQREFAPANQWETLGFTINASARYGITFLKGDFDESDQGTGHFTAVPNVASFTTTVLGTVGPNGVGSALDGPMARLVISTTQYSPAMGSRLTWALQRSMPA